MATVVSLGLFKKHVRADDFADDDTYLQHLIDAAQESVINATNRTESELTEYGRRYISVHITARYNGISRTLVQPARIGKYYADARSTGHTTGPN
jgi:hypothetical protein